MTDIVMLRGVIGEAPRGAASSRGRPTADAIAAPESPELRGRADSYKAHPSLAVVHAHTYLLDG